VAIADTQELVEAANRQSIRTPFADVAYFLQDVLGRQLVAYIAGVEATKTVSRWASGKVDAPRLKHEKRLRIAYEITFLLTAFEAPRVVKAWFIGLNPQLDDRAPAEVIRKASDDAELKEAVAAARAFIAGG
jgi:hypothetical protein